MCAYACVRERDREREKEERGKERFPLSLSEGGAAPEFREAVSSVSLAVCVCVRSCVGGGHGVPGGQSLH